MSAQDSMDAHPKKTAIPRCLGVGIGVGTALGLVLDSLALGVALGVAIGVAVGWGRSRAAPPAG